MAKRSRDRARRRLPEQSKGATQAAPRNVSTQVVSALCVALLAVVVLVFFPAMRNGFIINYDDDLYVTKNPHVQGGLTLSGLKWAFVTPHASNWHPLTWISHMLDCQLFGLNPAGHHATSILFHAMTTILLFLLLREMTGATWSSMFVAALFGLHPAHVESVAWVSERKDVLSAFLFILTVWAYVRYARAQPPSPWGGRGGNRPHSGTPPLTTTELPDSTYHRVLCYVLALLCFALGLMSKPMLVTVPFVLLLLDFWPLRRFPPSFTGQQISAVRLLLAEKIPFLLTSRL